MFDFTDDDHRDLAKTARAAVGKVMISGYKESPLMNELYHDWFKVSFKSKKNNIVNTKVQECIWTNYDPYTAHGQLAIKI